MWLLFCCLRASVAEVALYAFWSMGTGLRVVYVYIYAICRHWFDLLGMAFATQQQTKKEGSGLVLTGTPTRSPSVYLILAKRG